MTLITPTSGRFDSQVVEPGPISIIGTEGIVLNYNDVDDKLVYRMG